MHLHNSIRYKFLYKVFFTITHKLTALAVVRFVRDSSLMIYAIMQLTLWIFLVRLENVSDKLVLLSKYRFVQIITHTT